MAFTFRKSLLLDESYQPTYKTNFSKKKATLNYQSVSFLIFKLQQSG